MKKDTGTRHNLIITVRQTALACKAEVTGHYVIYLLVVYEHAKQTSGKKSIIMARVIIISIYFISFRTVSSARGYTVCI